MKKLRMILILIMATKPVFAYIDPGTGTALAGSLWPLIVSFFAAIGAFLIKYFWCPIKGFFKGKNE